MQSGPESGWLGGSRGWFWGGGSGHEFGDRCYY